MNIIKVKEKSLLNQRRQRLAVWYVPILVLGALSDLLELSGSFDIFYKFTNSILLLLTLLWSTCYIVKKMSILRTVSLLSSTTQVLISIDTVYCAFTPAVPHTQMVILVNILILTANTMFSVATYQGITILTNVVISIVTFFVCMLFTNGHDFQQYAVMVLLVFAYIGIFGLHIARISEQLQDENETIKQEEEELMHVLRLNKEQLKLYIELAKKEQSEDETLLILNKFSEKTQKYVVDNVMKYVKAQATTSKQIEESFPELSSSERDIVQLILRGYKLGSICTMLNKSESNINTQRANIRRKLRLQSADNLNDALQKRMMKIE
ncbi:helix-turn-helix transcriptional regulator [Prevotella sp.]|uniref:helix-turn-helix transcriptional regulator n=1 Tax=Prevotella sp. TaxID=59823 RepID=UPI003FEDDF88